MPTTKVAFILGTRPEIIKLAPVIKAAEKAGLDWILIHTNQHYSPELDQIFFEELDLKAPHHNLNIQSGSQIQQMARMLERLEPILVDFKPDWVIVQGDTNSVLAGALAAVKLNIQIAHVEAGLRSGDRAMPEENNRILTDHISQLLLCPTKECADTVLKEGINPDWIKIVGNTIVDAVLQGRELSKNIDLNSFGVKKGEFFLLTLHRPANVDQKSDLEAVISFLEKIYHQTHTPFLLPIHPRTKASLEKHGLRFPDGVKVIDPLGYRAFIALELAAKTIFTDSGGIQEEACILGVPCITLRDSTERPETVTVGANRVVFRDYNQAIEALKYFAQKPKWVNPYGKGDSSLQIIRELTR